MAKTKTTEELSDEIGTQETDLELPNRSYQADEMYYFFESSRSPTGGISECFVHRTCIGSHFEDGLQVFHWDDTHAVETNLISRHSATKYLEDMYQNILIQEQHERDDFNQYNKIIPPSWEKIAKFMEYLTYFRGYVKKYGQREVHFSRETGKCTITGPVRDKK